MTENPLVRMQRRILDVLLEELQGMMNDVLRGMLDPDKIMNMIRAMGIDMSQLSNFASVLSSSPKFDPYAILGLSKDCSAEEVKGGYREMMSRLHPNHAGQRYHFLATMVNLAY
ncbi:unnamed protein product, partial [marine sediment metagenome]